MAKHYSIDIKNLITRMYNEGNTVRKISSILKIPKSSVHDIVQKNAERGINERLMGSGRPPILDNKDLNQIVKKVSLNPKITSKELSKTINKPVSPHTIRNNLHLLGIHSRVAAKKPFLSDTHKKIDYHGY